MRSQLRPAQCPCGGGVYDDCCGPFHDGTVLPATAEQLMRSRYSAFVVGNADYLFRTWHPRTRPNTVELDDTTWLGLEILDVVDGSPDDDTGIVEFIASYDGGAMRERSTFARRAGRWFYLDAL